MPPPPTSRRHIHHPLTCGSHMAAPRYVRLGEHLLADLGGWVVLHLHERKRGARFVRLGGARRVGWRSIPWATTDRSSGRSGPACPPAVGFSRGHEPTPHARAARPAVAGWRPPPRPRSGANGLHAWTCWSASLCCQTLTSSSLLGGMNFSHG